MKETKDEFKQNLQKVLEAEYEAEFTVEREIQIYREVKEVLENKKKLQIYYDVREKLEKAGIEKPQKLSNRTRLLIVLYCLGCLIISSGVLHSISNLIDTGLWVYKPEIRLFLLELGDAAITVIMPLFIWPALAIFLVPIAMIIIVPSSWLFPDFVEKNIMDKIAVCTDWIRNVWDS